MQGSLKLKTTQLWDSIKIRRNSPEQKSRDLRTSTGVKIFKILQSMWTNLQRIRSKWINCLKKRIRQVDF